MVDLFYLPGTSMRIKLKSEQLNTLAKRLRFEVMLQQPRDVRGILEVPGNKIPWDESGLNKFDKARRRPIRLTFSVEETKNGFICDVHPALAQHSHTLLSSEQVILNLIQIPSFEYRHQRLYNIGNLMGR